MRHTAVIRRCGLTLTAFALAALSGCGGWDGHFCLCGYTTQPMYDLSIRTVRVPIFKNVTMRRGLEFEITKAVIREIQSKTPYRVVQCSDDADTELLGTVVGMNKGIVNVNQLGEIRAAETILTVELVWRDLRPGQSGGVLSQPLPGKPGDPLPPPLPIGAGPPPPPVVVQAVGQFDPEIGGSLATGQQQAIDRLAVQIISMMEKPW